MEAPVEAVVIDGLVGRNRRRSLLVQLFGTRETLPVDVTKATITGVDSENLLNCTLFDRTPAVV
jgi:hypothetical protein